MTLLAATLLTVSLLLAAPTMAQTITISRAGSRPARSAPAENFTGDVWVEMLFEAADSSQASGGSVTFEAGARTAWHSHPGGQILVVTSGTGRVQQWSGPIEEIHVGDVVRIPPGQRHWHGASPRASMTYIAIAQPRDGTSVEWMAKVSEEQYNGGQQPQPSSRQQATTGASGALQQKIAPGLAMLTDEVLFGDMW